MCFFRNNLKASYSKKFCWQFSWEQLSTKEAVSLKRRRKEKTGGGFLFKVLCNQDDVSGKIKCFGTFFIYLFLKRGRFFQQGFDLRCAQVAAQVDISGCHRMKPGQSLTTQRIDAESFKADAGNKSHSVAKTARLFFFFFPFRLILTCSRLNSTKPCKRWLHVF